MEDDLAHTPSQDLAHTPSHDAASADTEQPPPPGPVLRAPRRARTSLLTWGTAALVIVIVIVLVVVKVTGTSTTTSPTTGPPATPAPSSVVHAITAIPSSVFDDVGVTSTDVTVSAPVLLQGQPRLADAGKPEVLFVGGEFCPYCAAERWGLVAALARFGKFSGLDAMQSASNEAFPATPTFTFVQTRYHSPYVAAVLIEHYGEQKNPAGTAYEQLEPLPGADRVLMDKYGGATPGVPAGTLPFLDVANRAIVDGASFSPAVFQQLTSAQIATALSDAKAPSTQAVVATANYLSAAICAADGERPADVCTSVGVLAADTALGLTP